MAQNGVYQRREGPVARLGREHHQPLRQGRQPDQQGPARRRDGLAVRRHLHVTRELPFHRAQAHCSLAHAAEGEVSLA